MKQTVIDQIELPGATNEVRVRLGLLIVDEGQEESRKFHRFTVEPGMDFDWVRGLVEANLKDLGYPPIPDAEWAKVVRLIAS